MPGNSPPKIDLARLALRHGQGRRLDLELPPPEASVGGQRYASQPDVQAARLEVSRTSSGFALRLRLDAVLEGPCARCLEPARVELEINSREVEQSGSDEELSSPYVSDEVVDVGRWVDDAIALAMPQRPLCRPDCAGLCPVCGTSLNDVDPDEHRHETGGDPRWAKLRELDI